MKRRDFLIGSAGIAGIVGSLTARAQAVPCPPPSLTVTGGQSASTTCQPPVAAKTTGAPSWFQAMPDRTWTRVAVGSGSGYGSGATLHLARPIPTPPGMSPSPSLTAYSGGTVDQERAELLVHGGGHDAYAGNEVYALALRSETPGWVRLNEPSAGAFTGGGGEHNGPGQYTADIGVNDAPQTSHTYNRLVFAGGRLWLPGLAGMQIAHGGANRSTSRLFWFDRSAARWYAGAKTLTDAQASQYNIGFCEESPVIYVPADNAIWTSYANLAGNGPVPVLVRIDASSGTVTTWTNAQSSGFWQSGATVIGGTRLVALRTANVNGISWGGPGLYVWDSGSPISPFAPTKVAVDDQTGGLNWAGSECGGVYHAASNAILASNGNGEDFVKLAVPANPKTGTWVATRVRPSNAAAAGRVVPSNPSGYAYGRWNLIQDMGNGQSAVVFLPDDAAEKATYVYKLPVSGV